MLLIQQLYYFRPLYLCALQWRQYDGRFEVLEAGFLNKNIRRLGYSLCIAWSEVGSNAFHRNVGDYLAVDKA
jgi:hypothetical protein